MRLAIIGPGVLPIPAIYGGGIETLITSFIKKNNNRDIDITVYSCPGAEKVQKDYPHIKFRNIKNDRDKNLWIRRINKALLTFGDKVFPGHYVMIPSAFQVEVVRELRTSKYDCVIVENNIEILPFIKNVSARLIYHAHYDDVNSEIPIYEQKKYRHYFSNVDVIVGVSKFIENRFKSVLGNGTLEFYSLKNGVNTEQYCNDLTENQKNEIKKKYGIPLNVPTFMFAGRIVPEKGVLELIEAFSKIKCRACLVIAGGNSCSNSSRDEYFNKIKKVSDKIKNDIVFLGYIDNSKLSEIWKSIDFAVVPTYLVEEAAGLVVCEAMCAGKPIIISDSGAMPEYAIDSSAIIVNRDSDYINGIFGAMQTFIDNKDYWIECGKNNKKYALRLNEDMYYDNFVNIIKNTKNKLSTNIRSR